MAQTVHDLVERLPEEEKTTNTTETNSRISTPTIPPTVPRSIF